MSRIQQGEAIRGSLAKPGDASAPAGGTSGADGAGGEALRPPSPANLPGSPQVKAAAGGSTAPEVTVKPARAFRKRRKSRESLGQEQEREWEPRKQRRWGLRIVGALLGLVLAVALVFAGYFVADRWLVYDDHLNMQGEWHVDGSDASVIITDDLLVLSSDTEYEYSIDPVAKTISYQFGELQGEGRYWFSSDRNQLVIVDGSGYTALGTALDDLVRIVGDFIDNTFGDGATLPAGDGVTVLSR